MQLTLTIDDKAGDRIKKLVEPFDGTVQGYARRWAEKLCWLPMTDQEEIRALVEMKLRRLSVGTGASERTAEAPEGSKATPRRAARTPQPDSSQRHVFGTPPAPSDTNPEKAGALASAT
jgi:hypothetical protein